MDAGTRILMTMFKAFHSKHHLRQYMSRKDGSKRLPSIEDSVYATIKTWRMPKEEKGKTNYIYK